MKNLFAVALALLLAFSLIGCGNGEKIAVEENELPLIEGGSSVVLDGDETQAARLLSVDVKVLEIENSNENIGFKAEAIGSCGEEIEVGDIISVNTDFSSVADILSDYQTNNSFTIYFPFVSETSDGLAVKCMDAIPQTE